MGSNQIQPFAPFGQALKKLREKISETEGEVSGAVEIDQTVLHSFELGKTRPSEDVLLLLIRHFNLKDTEASELWRLAGYGDMPADETQYFMNDMHGGAHMAEMHNFDDYDTRVVYTDMIQVMVNNYGVIVNFMQGAGSGHGPLAVARVGMSKEHAKSVVEVLQTTLQQANELEKRAKQQQRQLPTGKKKQD